MPYFLRHSHVKEVPGVQICHVRLGCAAPRLEADATDATADMDMDMVHGVVTRGGAGRPANSHVHGYVLQLAGLLPTVLLRAWILQDLRRTEMRGYGVGGKDTQRWRNGRLAKASGFAHYLLSV